MSDKKLTPMWQQYFKIKNEYKDCILLYRLGDFYEMFNEDAEIGSKILGITLTKRSAGNDTTAPMCGVPFHSVSGYVKKLIDAGYSVAMCEQVSDPKEKGMVEREVLRVVTPGTVLEDSILTDAQPNYLAYIYSEKNTFGISWIDISTGQFNVYSYSGDNYLSRIQDILAMIQPKEILANEDIFKHRDEIPYFEMFSIKPKMFSSGYNSLNSATEYLKEYFKVSNLDVFNLSVKNQIMATSQILSYAVQTQKQLLGNIRKVQVLNEGNCMVLDINTRRNLELTQNVRDGKKEGTLLSVLDYTSTPMGSRKLKNAIEQPLQNSIEINSRLDAIEEMLEHKTEAVQLQSLLADIKDVERIISRIMLGIVVPKELISLSEAIKLTSQLKRILFNMKSLALKELDSQIDFLDDLSQQLERALDKERISENEKFFINEAYSAEYSEYKNIAKNADKWILEIQNRERERTGIKNLKVARNNVFGFYIEVTKSFLSQVPSDYIRRQTLVGSERYTIAEMMDIEEKVNSAESRLEEIQKNILNEIQKRIKEDYSKIKNYIDALGKLDFILSLSRAALVNNYAKPKISEEIKDINIVSGRHPVVERILTKTGYVANDTHLSENDRTQIISGPNMAGKSTYMRQVALIVLMAHVGSYVPAESAEIPIVDRIFTRIGSSDDLFTGQSTFMVEMNEIAMILNCATPKSLLIIDEIGRGTSTLDGLSIAWAIITYINEHIRAKTLFSTHFHELIELNDIDGIKNYHILINEQNNKITFLYKIVPGGAQRSYGIEVAEIAGVNKAVIKNARQIIKNLELNNNGLDIPNLVDKVGTQGNLFEVVTSEYEERIKQLNLDNMTPVQALTYLMDLKTEIIKKDE